MVRLNLSSDDIRNCKKNNVHYRKEFTIWHINRDFHLKKCKLLKMFTASKTRKSVRKVSKTQSGNEL